MVYELELLYRVETSHEESESTVALVLPGWIHLLLQKNGFFILLVVIVNTVQFPSLSSGWAPSDF